MRTIQKTCLLLLLSLLAYGAHAQRNVIKVNPLSLFVLTGNAAYEHVLTPNVSLQLGGYYTGMKLDGNWLQGNEVTYRGWSVTPEVRLYSFAKKEAPRGFYLAPFMRYRQFNVQGDLDFEFEGQTISQEAEVRLRSM